MAETLVSWLGHTLLCCVARATIYSIVTKYVRNTCSRVCLQCDYHYGTIMLCYVVSALSGKCEYLQNTDVRLFADYLQSMITVIIMWCMRSVTLLTDTFDDLIPRTTTERGTVRFGNDLFTNFPTGTSELMVIPTPVSLSFPLGSALGVLGEPFRTDFVGGKGC